MFRSPDLRIEARRPAFPGGCPLTENPVVGACRTLDRPTPRLQWRDRVGFAPTSHAHREASDLGRVYPTSSAR